MRIIDGRREVHDLGAREDWVLREPDEAARAEARADSRRDERLRSKYGLTAREYDELERQQGGVCAICRRPERAMRAGVRKRLSVDHNHDTRLVRGLLCHACNVALGFLQDDPDWIDEFARRARRYLSGLRVVA